ncbi:hypothetical protein GQ42DRAFT_160589 [Ramicandelaber brevisporus]|nr:hypothetical protein GQ42DRAFT_160589 [Ramicandelaber brevisporus]
MSRTAEIITLQFGVTANHVGAHVWNLQESYPEELSERGVVDHEVLYRRVEQSKHRSQYQFDEPSASSSAPLLTPRALIFSRSRGEVGGFGSWGDVARSGATKTATTTAAATATAAAAGNEKVAWSGEVTRHDLYQQQEQQQQQQQSSRTELHGASGGNSAKNSVGDDIQLWTDFFMPHAPNPSRMLVSMGDLGASVASTRRLLSQSHQHDQGFDDYSNLDSILSGDNEQMSAHGDLFGDGRTVYLDQRNGFSGAAGADVEVLETKLRYLAEECDALQGFHVLTSLDAGGIAGYSTSLMQDLHDEFPKLSIAAFGTVSQPLQHHMDNKRNKLMPLWDVMSHQPMLSQQQQQQQQQYDEDKKQQQSLLNLCLSLDALLFGSGSGAHCSSLIPIVIPFDPQSTLFTRTSWPAMAIETITLPYRSPRWASNQKHRGGLSEWTADITSSGQYPLVDLAARHSSTSEWRMFSTAGSIPAKDLDEVGGNALTMLTVDRPQPTAGSYARGDNPPVYIPSVFPRSLDIESDYSTKAFASKTLAPSTLKSVANAYKQFAKKDATVLNMEVDELKEANERFLQLADVYTH